jgi:1,4-alpha-glucan branching enzyme
MAELCYDGFLSHSVMIYKLLSDFLLSINISYYVKYYTEILNLLVLSFGGFLAVLTTMSFYMKERFGAWQVGNDSTKGKVEFNIFFPDISADPGQYTTAKTAANVNKPAEYGDPQIKTIQVIGTFQIKLGQVAWDKASAPQMTKKNHPKGNVWSFITPVELDAGFYEYQYFVTFIDGTQRIVSDPCARYGGSRNLDRLDPNPRENLNAGIVVGGSIETVPPLAAGRKHLRDLVVYELNLDDFTDEFRRARATLDAVIDKLDYIKDLGFNAILVMPWTAWPGEGFNWGYEPFLYFAVAYRYANDLDKPSEKLSYLKVFIKECHKRGIHVIMDGVFNHVTGNNKFPYYLFYKNPLASPYTGQFGGSFFGLTDLDFNNGCLEEYVRDVCFYWMDNFGVDGIRFDNTTNFLVWEDFNARRVNPRGLPNLIRDINTHAADPNFSTTLEHLAMDAALVVNAVNATSYWNNALYGVAFNYLYNYSVPSDLMTALDNKKGLIGNHIATTYLSNHDHSHLAWQAGASSNEGSRLWFRTQPLAIAQMTFPGSPMIQNGQEFAEDYWLVEEDKSGGRRVQPRPLHWSFANDDFGKALVDVYKKLIRIRQDFPGLRSDNVYPVDWPNNQSRFNEQGYGIDRDAGIVIYHRWGDDATGKLQLFIIVLNFSQSTKSVSVPFPTNGVWEDLLSGWKPTITGNRLNCDVDSNWGKVFFQ